MAKRKRERTPYLIPYDAFVPPDVEPALVAPGPPHLRLLRRVPTPFVVCQQAPGENYWVVGLLNEHSSMEYRQDYVVLIPKKSKLPPWSPQELAIACARRLNEYRGVVTLERWEDGCCRFSAVFASNSMWTFCVWSTDPEGCPSVSPRPKGWVSGQPLPVELPRREVAGQFDGCHHPPEADKSKFSKTARALLP